MGPWVADEMEKLLSRERLYRSVIKSRIGNEDEELNLAEVLTLALLMEHIRGQRSMLKRCEDSLGGEG